MTGWKERLRQVLGLGRPGDGGQGNGPSISCQDALERLYEFLDGELEAGERAEVEKHFEICARCYPRLLFERSFLQGLERLQEGGEAPSDLKERVLEMISREGGGAS